MSITGNTTRLCCGDEALSPGIWPPHRSVANVEFEAARAAAKLINDAEALPGHPIVGACGGSDRRRNSRADSTRGQHRAQESAKTCGKLTRHVVSKSTLRNPRDVRAG